jgi:asparagine synthase (glutamine-hydrolysing)
VRRALAELLPHEIRWRGGKTSLTPSISQGMLAFEQEYLEKIIHHGSGLICQYVNMERLSQIFHRYKLKKQGEDCFTVWAAVILDKWLHQHDQFGKETDFK